MGRWLVQGRDLDEGMGALWSSIPGATPFESRETARSFVAGRMARDIEEGSLVQYRVVEEGSDESFSQPTDALEY